MPQSTARKQWKAPPEDKQPLFLRSELDDYGLDVYEFRVLAHITRRQGKIKEGGTKPRGCFAKQKTIAETCNMSTRKAQDALRVLCGAGLIERQQQTGRTNIYILAPASNWKPPSELAKIRESFKLNDFKQPKVDNTTSNEVLEDDLPS